MTERVVSFTHKKWFLFGHCLLSIKVSLACLLLTLSPTRHLSWPLLVLTTLLMFFYGLSLFGIYHHIFVVILSTTTALYILTGMSVMVSLMTSSIYWMSTLCSSLAFVVSLNFSIDLFDLKNHVFDIEANHWPIADDRRHKGIVRRKVSSEYRF